MRILYAALKYDYGQSDRGYSFEHYNFYHSLLHMGHDIIYFDFMTIMQEHGKKEMNRRLLDVVLTEKPDIMFTVLFKDELDKAVIKEISKSTDTTTINWFCDDHWRFDNFSCDWAPCFNWVITTAKSALPKYAARGYKNVIKSQWACNTFLYRKLDLPLKYDVTFVGQPHGNRREFIDALIDAGIDAKAWGSGWESGRISQEDMIRVFNQSRINLNLSNASIYASSPTVNSACGLISKSLNTMPFGSGIKSVGKRCLSALNKTTEADRIQLADQIKGRNFEVPGCGGFTLTGSAENLEEYYEPGRDVVCFEDKEDLVGKVRYYLEHEEKRAVIARTGYERTLHEHTYVHRFDLIFRHIGLPSEPVDAILKGDVAPGRTSEVL